MENESDKLLDAQSLHSEEKQTHKPRRSFPRRFTIWIFKILITVYILMIIASGYWYWMHPIRQEQMDAAATWWKQIGETYGLPAPKESK